MENTQIRRESSGVIYRGAMYTEMYKTVVRRSVTSLRVRVQFCVLRYLSRCVFLDTCLTLDKCIQLHTHIQRKNNFKNTVQHTCIGDTPVPVRKRVHKYVDVGRGPVWLWFVLCALQIDVDKCIFRSF